MHNGRTGRECEKSCEIAPVLHLRGAKGREDVREDSRMNVDENQGMRSGEDLERSLIERHFILIYASCYTEPEGGKRVCEYSSMKHKTICSTFTR